MHAARTAIIETPTWAWSEIAISDHLLYSFARFASRLPIVITGLSL